MSESARRVLFFLPHTHWDREWYQPFEEFQRRLVATLDLVLELLERDERWSHFHLDGQTALVDDYLDIRPDREETLRTFIAGGRLSCGPWTTLVDEFLVSGESIIRNLEVGLERAASLGGALPIGYLPDQFGHISQMPQILRSLGIDRAVVWRGVPAEIAGVGFMWEAPDGSRVRVASLPQGYSNAMELPEESDRFTRSVDDAQRRLLPFLGEREPALLMAGSDHERPSPTLADRVDSLRVSGRAARIGSLTDYFDELQPPTQVWRGELRSAARANLLPNTYSVRPHQKLARARAEHLLERYAEPLATLVGENYPEEALREAWMLLHLNGAHDSVCGCSVDEVVMAVDERTERATQLAEGIAHAALTELASRATSAGTIAFNPSPFERAGVPALGWGVPEPTRAQQLPAVVAGDRVIFRAGEGQVSLRFEDQGDDGDLYTFCPRDPAAILAPRPVAEIEALFESERVGLRVTATHDHDDFVRVEVAVDNRAPDHRLRALLGLPQRTQGTRAGSPFEIVRRPAAGEGGPTEPPSRCWPARGFVLAGGSGFLTEQVVEYELVDETTLALTLMRCTGTISRPEPIATRTIVAGPDVPTPQAQLLGAHTFSFGVLLRDPGPRVLEVWEAFALPLMTVDAPGGGSRANSGRLIDIAAPALSSIRRRDGRIEVRIWNPWTQVAPARVEGRELELRPAEIRTVTVEG